MKRFIPLLMALLFLSGCGAVSAEKRFHPAYSARQGRNRACLQTSGYPDARNGGVISKKQLVFTGK